MKEIPRSFQFRRCIYNIDMRKRDFALDPARGRLTNRTKAALHSQQMKIKIKTIH